MSSHRIETVWFIYVYMCAYACVCAHRRQRSMLVVFLVYLFKMGGAPADRGQLWGVKPFLPPFQAFGVEVQVTWLLNQVLSPAKLSRHTELALNGLASLAGPQGPGILLFLHPQHWGLSAQCFTWVWDQTQTLTFVPQALIGRANPYPQFNPVNPV